MGSSGCDRGPRAGAIRDHRPVPVRARRAALTPRPADPAAAPHQADAGTNPPCCAPGRVATAPRAPTQAGGRTDTDPTDQPEPVKAALTPMIVDHSGHLLKLADGVSPDPRRGLGFGRVVLRRQCWASAQLARGWMRTGWLHYLGDVSQALELASAGFSTGLDCGSPSTVARCAALQGRTHALGGDRRACSVACTTAERALGRAMPADEPDWIQFFTAEQLTAEMLYMASDLVRQLHFVIYPVERRR
jgi:hypothetical protein